MKLIDTKGDAQQVVELDALIAFAESQVRRIQRDRSSLENAEDIFIRQGKTEQAREMERVNWLRQGEQTALRNVIEWAKDWKEDTDAFLVSDANVAG